MKTQIFESYAEFSGRFDKSVNGVSGAYAKKHPNWGQMNETNRGCWNCGECTNCEFCEGCWDCDGCLRCYMLDGKTNYKYDRAPT